MKPFPITNTVNQVLTMENHWNTNSFNFDHLVDLSDKDKQLICMASFVGNSELSGYAMTDELKQHIKESELPKHFSSSLIYHSTVVVPDEFRHGLVTKRLLNVIEDTPSYIENCTVDELYDLIKGQDSGERVWKNMYHALLSLLYSEIQNKAIYSLASNYAENQELRRIFNCIKDDEIRHVDGFFNEIKSLCKYDPSHIDKFIKSLNEDTIGYQVQFHNTYKKTFAHVSFLFGTESIITNCTKFYNKCEKLFGKESMPNVEKNNLMNNRKYLFTNMDKKEYATLFSTQIKVSRDSHLIKK